MQGNFSHSNETKILNRFERMALETRDAIKRVTAQE
jgi:hypothetical protein